MSRHLSWILILGVAAAVFYAAAHGWISLIFSYIFIVIGAAAPFLLSYWIQADLAIPKWVILLWAGLMVYTVGVIGQPGLLVPVGFLVCPDGYAETSVAVESTVLYDGATNTAAVLSCLGGQEAVQPGNWAVLLAGIGIYTLLFLPMLVIAALVNHFRKPDWGPGRCFAITQLLYWPMIGIALYLPGLAAFLRAGAQALVL